MNLFFRLLCLLLVALLSRGKKAESYRQPSTLRLTVAALDIDLNMHINNGRYLSLADLGRIQFLHKTGVLPGILKNRWMPLVGSVDIDYKKSIKLFQRFHIKTELMYWDEKWFYFQHTFIVNGTISAVANVKSLLIDRSRKTVPPAAVFALLGDIPTPPELPESIAGWVAAKAPRPTA
ncbi:acyl-CoA thioesterase [Pseudomonas entomophila]|uniref:acyl-CoA thioesterase n=1 Tax=Pseudomonas entomophila TaxID=312306 RepID=UPI002406F7AE|nr:acyl-CoA thioesterase [Pseudomonas entomophila]MDF9616401.1 acyl-CoA thioesterase [Pseudomonas entomophila]